MAAARLSQFSISKSIKASQISINNFSSGSENNYLSLRRPFNALDFNPSTNSVYISEASRQLARAVNALYLVPNSNVQIIELSIENALHAVYLHSAATAVLMNINSDVVTKNLIEEINNDIKLINEGAHHVLINSSLWKKNIMYPDNINPAEDCLMEYWMQLREILLKESDYWHVWIGWYERRLAGIPDSPETEQIFVDPALESMWKQGPAVVNAWIASRLREVRVELAARGEDSPPGTPVQNPAPTLPSGEGGLRSEPGGVAMPETSPDPTRSASGRPPSPEGREGAKPETPRVRTAAEAPPATPDLLSMPDISGIGTPIATKGPDGRVTVTGNPTYDPFDPGAERAEVVRAHMVNIAVLRAGLPRQTPQYVFLSLAAYEAAMPTEASGGTVLTLKHQFAVLRKSFRDKNLRASFFDGIDTSVSIFVAQHPKVIKLSRTENKREEIIEQTPFDLARAADPKIEKGFANLQKAAEAAHMAGLVDDTVVAQTASDLNTIRNLPDDIIVRPDDRIAPLPVSARKRFLVSRIGWVASIATVGASVTILKDGGEAGRNFLWVAQQLWNLLRGLIGG